MKKKFITTLNLTVLACLLFSQTINATSSVSPYDQPLKPRLVVLTDIAPADREPDDMESMIRLLAHADLFEIEAIITTCGWNSCGMLYPQEWADSAQAVINAYEQDLPNLMKRSKQRDFLPLDQEESQQFIGYWPSANYLRSRTMMGSTGMGTAQLGEKNHSAGSDFLIKLADEADPRPLWVAVWGGGNTLAQAIWQVQQTRSEADLKTFLHKLRVYTITDQDACGQQYELSSHSWMLKNFPDDLFFIWDESAWISQNYVGSTNWPSYEEHIQNHGHLGKIYPKFKYGVEGDTPSFLYILPNGLSDPEQPGNGGWGGYFKREASPNKALQCYTNCNWNVKIRSEHYERHHFYPAIFNNFAARMDWAAKGKGNRNPIAIVNGQDGLEAIHLSAQAGEEITLDATQSYDPEKDKLTVHWWMLPEAGTYGGALPIYEPYAARTTFRLPTDSKGQQLHVICEVTDSGTPCLTAYRRIIIDVAP